MVNSHSKAVLTGLAGLSLSAALAGCSTGTPDRPAADTPVMSSSRSTGGQTSSPPPDSAAPRYTDGTFQADGIYGGGPSSIGVSVTLAADVITAVEVTTHATNPTSLDYQQRFAAAAPDAVVGRPIDEVELNRIAGSSSTPDGFNDALDKIKEQAAR